VERASEQQLLQLAQRRVVEQALSVGQADAVPKRKFVKKTHGLAYARGLTTRELAERELKDTEHTQLCNNRPNTHLWRVIRKQSSYSNVIHLLLPHLLSVYQFAPQSARGLGVLRAPRTA